jgi:hypothetical protein
MLVSSEKEKMSEMVIRTEVSIRKGVRQLLGKHVVIRKKVS